MRSNAIVMKIEYEATFENIDKNDIRCRLKKIGAKLIYPEFLQKRDVFFLPNKKRHTWLRVRKEKGKNTMSLKIIDGNKIEDQREICLKVGNYDNAVEFLKMIGCEWKSYQETKREIWKLEDVEISIDEWPFLEPFAEIEGKSEDKVRNICQKLDLDYKNALFCAIGYLYKRKYGLALDQINNKTPKITFEMDNPFI